MRRRPWCWICWWVAERLFGVDDGEVEVEGAEGVVLVMVEFAMADGAVFMQGSFQLHAADN